MNRRTSILIAFFALAVGAIFYSGRNDSDRQSVAVRDAPPAIQAAVPAVSPVELTNESDLEDRLQYESIGKDLGLAIKNPEPDQLVELTELFQCTVESNTGKPSTYYSASAVCDGYGPRGKVTHLYLAKHLVDAHYAPIQLCHTPEVILYNTQKSNCDRMEDRVNSVIGYARVKH